MSLLSRLHSLRRLGNLGFGAFSRLFSLASQFAVLFLLAKVLPKSAFGDFMTAFALMRVLAAGLGTGLATLLVYHISRAASAAREHSLHRSVFIVGFFITVPTAIAIALAGTAISQWAGKPSLDYWIVWMTPFMVISTMLTISSGALEGRGRVGYSIFVTEFLPNLTRLLLIPSLLLAGYGYESIPVAMTASVLVPWLVVLPSLGKGISSGFASLTSWDFGFAGKLTLHSFASMQLQGIDMLVVGWLFPSEVAADYAIASRVAALVPFLQQIAVKTFMANAGKALHLNDKASLQLEIDVTRHKAAMLVTATAAIAAIGYPLLISFMETFGSSMSLFALLAAGALYRSYFPGADALIRVAGHASFSLAIMLSSLSFLLIIPLLLEETIGIHAVTVSMFVSGVILNPIMASFIRRRLGVVLIDRSVVLPMFVGLAGIAICTAAETNLTLWFSGVVVLLVSLPLLHNAERSRRARDADDLTRPRTDT